MPVNYVTALKQNRLNAVTQFIDAESPIPGYIEIGTAAAPPAWAPAEILVRITLEDPSFDPATSTPSVAINMRKPAAADLSGIAGNTGAAATARICDGDDNVVVTGLVVGLAITTGVEIALSALNIGAGQTVTLTSGVITHAA